MNQKRIFTDKELEEMGTRTLDLVLEAIEAGNKEKAKELAQRMYGEFNFLHDGYMFWVTGLQTYIYKNYGIDALEEAERMGIVLPGLSLVHQLYLMVQELGYGKCGNHALMLALEKMSNTQVKQLQG